MIPWKQQPKEVLLHWIGSLDNPAIHSTLSDWEQHFLASISFQILRSGSVSQKQQEVLEKIYAENTK